MQTISLNTAVRTRSTKPASATHTIDTMVRTLLGTLAAKATFAGEATDNLFGLQITAKFTASAVVVWKLNGSQVGRFYVRRKLLDAMQQSGAMTGLFELQAAERKNRARAALLRQGVFCTALLTDAYQALANPHFELPEELKKIRAVALGGVHYFVRSDAQQALGLKVDSIGACARDINPADGITAVDPLDSDLFALDSVHGYHAVVTEPGLYGMIFESDEPEAEAFRDWAARVVHKLIKERGMGKIAASGPTAAAAMDGLHSIMTDPTIIAAHAVGTAMQRAR